MLYLRIPHEKKLQAMMEQNAAAGKRFEGTPTQFVQALVEMVLDDAIPDDSEPAKESEATSRKRGSAKT